MSCWIVIELIGTLCICEQYSTGYSDSNGNCSLSHSASVRECVFVYLHISLSLTWHKQTHNIISLLFVFALSKYYNNRSVRKITNVRVPHKNMQAIHTNEIWIKMNFFGKLEHIHLWLDFRNNFSLALCFSQCRLLGSVLFLPPYANTWNIFMAVW